MAIHHVRTKGKPKLIDGELRHTLYDAGPYRIKYRKEGGEWTVTVMKDGWSRPVSWNTVSVPNPESARIAYDVAERARKNQALDEVRVLGGVGKMNRKFPRATFDKVFSGLDGWSTGRKRNLIRALRDGGFLTWKKASGKLALTEEGIERLRDSENIVREYQRFLPEEIKANRKKEK